MLKGDLGTVLSVDLSCSKCQRTPFTQELAARYLGGRGYNASLLWDQVARGIDPLSADNVLILGVGPLTGTSALSSGRTTITAKGPATNLYLKTSVGGALGGALRMAGFCHVVVRGRSDHPVYLWIDDDTVQLRDARDLWGNDVRETNAAIRADVGDANVRTAVIGPAGEKLVMFAAIMCSDYNAAARGGIGAVMGSKNLKAIAVRGNRPVSVAEPALFQQAINQSWDLYHAESGVPGTHRYGTSGGIPAINALGCYPSYNFQGGFFEHADKISGQHLEEAGYLKRRAGCFACPMSCHRYCEVSGGAFAGAYTGGPEYESFGALGAGCGVSDTEAIIRANELCNLYGLDTISTGSVIQWVMECHQRDLQFDRDGLDLSWGNSGTLVELVRRIALRQGIGDLLALGTKRAAERIGQGSEDWAIQAKGLEQSRVETRSAFSYALAFAVNPRGPDHLMTETLAEFGMSPEMVGVIEKITGDKRYATPYSTEKRAEIVRWHEDVYAVTDALGLCAFGSTAQYYLTPDMMAALFSASTGVPVDGERIMRLGRKIVTMERMFNMREGATRADDVLPKRLRTERLAGREGQIAINSPEVMDPLLDRYYKLHGWNLASGIPARETLESLGLGTWADQLERSEQ
jgi:aldehyde:ferredoxin oxidoreductase